MADELVEKLTLATTRLSLWTRFEGMTNVGAFALCTDSSLSSLFACAASTHWLEQNEDRTFWPPDWPEEDGGDDALNPPGELLESRYRAALSSAGPSEPGDEDISAHVRESFFHLVDALKHLRRTGFFAPETILLVCGTTPDPTMLSLATESVSQLNGIGVLSRWKKAWPHAFAAET